MSERIYIEPPDLAPPPDPYTHAIRAGETVYIAGQVAADEHNRVVGIGDARRQAEQCWKNLASAIEAAGGGVENIIKITIFLKDIRHGDAEIEVRQKLFEEGRFPICTQVQVANLARPDLLMEIDAVAVLDA